MSLSYKTSVSKTWRLKEFDGILKDYYQVVTKSITESKYLFHDKILWTKMAMISFENFQLCDVGDMAIDHKLI
jgi:hypothetical protein